MRYRILSGVDNKTLEVEEGVISLWKKLGICSREEGIKKVGNLVLSLLDTDTDRIVGATTAKLSWRVTPGGWFYDFGMSVLPGHARRPFLLERTIDFLRDNGNRSAKGVVIVKKNKKISDKLLKRYGFSYQSYPVFPSGVYYRLFNGK